MRRFLLTLTIITFAGWSQVPQQQAQPPIVINNITPRETFWMGLLQLAVPTIVAAALASGITLYGVNRTHKHQAAENKANREHQLQVEIAKAEIAAKYKSQDNRWEFRKTMYVGLLDNIDQIVSLNAIAQTLLTKHQPLSQEYADRLFAALKQLSISANLAPLTASDDLLPLVNSVLGKMNNIPNRDVALSIENLANMNEVFLELRERVQETGRKDLWGSSEGEAKAEAAKQT